MIIKKYAETNIDESVFYGKIEVETESKSEWENVIRQLNVMHEDDCACHCNLKENAELVANGVTFAEDNNVPNKWFSVKERLPLDYQERVLVKIRNFDDIIGHPAVDTDRYICGSGWVRWNGHVTHWMPLPEPPKGELL